MNKESIAIQLKELADQNGVCFDEEILSRAVELAQFRLFPKGTTLKSIGGRRRPPLFLTDLCAAIILTAMGTILHGDLALTAVCAWTRV